MDLPYQHVQMGWVTLGALLLPVPIVVAVSSKLGTNLPLFVVGALLLVFAAAFGTLKVRVNESELSLQFGIGVIRRRVDLRSVRSFAEVQNPWYYGWGVRIYPHGILYNVSGLSAVELALADGNRLRVGTDEASKLFLVLESILGPPPPISELPAATPRRTHRRIRLIVLCFVGLLAALLPFLMRVQARPPVVSISADSVTIDNLFYGQTYAMSDIRKVELLQTLPAIRSRTNGYSAGGTLRGWFSLDTWGQGKLFVEQSHPPYLAIQLQNGYVILNYADRSDTEQLYQIIRHKVEVTAGR